MTDMLSRGPLLPLALAYHGVADVPLRDDPHGLFVRPQDLERQVVALRSWGYEAVTFSELVQRASTGCAEAAVAFTFDDGFSDNLEQLAPLAARLGLPGTVFVAPGLFGKPHPDHPSTRCMTSDEVLELGSQFEIGSHTMSHADLPTLSRVEQLRELRDSRDVLEQLLQRPVDIVAYPYGRTSETTIAAAREAGYRGGCLTSGNGSWNSPLEQPRQNMNNSSSLLGLRLKHRDQYEQFFRRRPLRALRRGRRIVLKALSSAK